MAFVGLLSWTDHGARLRKTKIVLSGTGSDDCGGKGLCVRYAIERKVPGGANLDAKMPINPELDIARVFCSES